MRQSPRTSRSIASPSPIPTVRSTILSLPPVTLTTGWPRTGALGDHRRYFGLVRSPQPVDPDHERVLRAMAREPAPWIVAVAVLGEIGYLVASRGTPAALDAFLQDLDDGTYTLDDGIEDIARVRVLVRRYADLPLGLVDAMVIACAERNGG